MRFPLPWRVEYCQRFREWHEKSLPQVVAANGSLVCTIQTDVCHPGMYDEQADRTALDIVASMNRRSSNNTMCDECGCDGCDGSETPCDRLHATKLTIQSDGSVIETRLPVLIQGIQCDALQYTGWDDQPCVIPDPGPGMGGL